MTSATLKSKNTMIGDRAEQRQISLAMPVETPECVRMTYQLAGPASRLGAYVIDTLLRVGILTFTLMVVACSGVFTWGISAGLFLIIWFVVEWFYFAVSEAVFNGKTVGKHVMGLRVIQQYGYPISWWSALSRNFIRTADSWVFYGVAFVSMTLTNRFQRLGDLVAGTVVIHDRPLALPVEPIILETIQPLNREDYNHYVPSVKTLTLIDQLLTRRTNARARIPVERGHELAKELAETLSRKLDYRGDPQLVTHYSMAFLARVHVTFLRETEDERDQSPVDKEPLVGGGA